MLRSPDTAWIELDGLSSKPGQPHGVVSIDRRDPHEIDDAIAVVRVPDNPDTYDVYVFAADTSGLYDDNVAVDQALHNIEARYRNHRTNIEEYVPMLPLDAIEDIQLTQGQTRSALVTSFRIGRDLPPTDVTIGYGQIEVDKNFVTSTFNKRCQRQPSYMRFVNASALILQHLYPPTRLSRRLTPTEYRKILEDRLKGGANINSPFMVSSNYFAGLEAMNHDLAIYRVLQDLQTDSDGIQVPVVPRFSHIPGPHDQLGVEVYSRVSSGLRRLEDFVMHGLFRRFIEGRILDDRDHMIVAKALERLNKRIDAKLRHGTLEPGYDDHWIKGGLEH